MSLDSKITELLKTPTEYPASIKDVIKEGTRQGEIIEVGEISKEQMIGILSGIAVYANQALSDVTNNGIGLYGLSKLNLEDTGAIKKNIGATTNLTTLIADASIFTGKYDILKSGNLLESESNQRKITQQVILNTFNSLRREGIITGEEDSYKLAAVIGQINFTLEQIKDWLGGTATIELNAQMDPPARSLIYAVKLVDEKAQSTLERVQGVTGGAVVVPTPATNTAPTNDLDVELNKFLGSKRLQIPLTTDETDTSKATGKLSSGDLF